MHIKKWLGLIGLAFALAWTSSQAQLKPGSDYKLQSKPQPVETGAKVEVIEFFWYGCPHCYDLEPYLQKWVAALPADVEFRRIPAVPTERWLNDARIYYTLESLNLLGTMHGKVFDAIHRDHVNLANEKTQLDWMARQGVDRQAYSAAWKSFSVQTRTKRAVQQSESYDITSVPTLVVDGRWQTSVSMAGGHDALLRILDGLIDMARQERAKKK